MKDSRLENIVFENIRLNGTKLSREDIEIQLTDCSENDFKVI